MSEHRSTLESDGAGVAPMDESRRYRLLAAARRRATLAVLAERAEPVDLAELAAEVVDRQYPDDGVDRGCHERVRLSLHHVHLPILAASGVCSYDRATNHVEANPAVLEQVLDGE